MKKPDNRFQIVLGEDTFFLRLSSQFSSASKAWQSLRHCNAEYELHILLDGACQLEVETRQLFLNRGNGVLIAPGQYHYPQVTSDHFHRFSVSFLISEGAIHDNLRRLAPVFLTFETSLEQFRMCRDIFREYDSSDAFRSEMLNSQLTELFVSLIRALHLTSADSVPAPYVERAREDLMDQFFTDHFHENGCAPLLAEKLHLSRRQMARVVEQHYGMSFQKKLMSTRMDRASWLLRTSDKRISEIAEILGYSSEAAFYEAFRSWFHMTPQQYRRQF